VIYPSPKEVAAVGLMDKVRGMLGQHGDKVEQGIDKVGDVVDDKTGGKYAGQVDKAQDVAKEGVDKLTGESGDGAR
jgi:MT0933-like antitoxin protein